jgi:hypothetical protein
MRLCGQEPEHHYMLVIFYHLLMEFSTARNKRLSILKSRLTSRVHYDILPKYYYYGPRLTQISHARLRMRSSSLIIIIVCMERLNLHIIIYLNVQNILVNEIFFFESYFSYWTFDLRNIYYYLAALTLISIQILLFLRQCINIFRKVNDFHKTQTHHAILYPKCNLQFPFVSLPLIFSYLDNGKWIEYVLMTIFNCSCVC